MKKYSIISIHSVVSLITNSSSELFVGESDKDISFIKEILQEFLTTLSKASNITEEEHTNIDSILTIDKIDESNVDKWADILIDWRNIPWDLQLEKFPEYDWNGTWDEKYNRHKKQVDKWKEVNFSKLREGLVGRVVIQGTSDNSIPSELFDIIEYRLMNKSLRIHQG